MIYLVSGLLLANHLTLIIAGIVEIYSPTTTFYNIFCTLLYVVDPLLIFLATAILQKTFYEQTLARYLST
jgi:phage-related protein